MVKLKDITHLNFDITQVVCVDKNRPGIFKVVNMYSDDIFFGDTKNVIAKLDWGEGRPALKHKDNKKISIELLEVKIEKNYKKIKKSFVLDVLIKLGVVNEL